VKKAFVFILLIFVFNLVLLGAHYHPDIRPGYGVTETGWLSDYFPPIKGTNVDTPVFIMDSGNLGATFLLMGGTHAREIAGMMAAIVFIENAAVDKGRVIVIPYSNASAASIADLQGDVPHFIELDSKSGPRIFAYGDRRTDIEDQGEPDPDIFIVEYSGEVFTDGSEARNLNRNYPGVFDGNATEKLAYAIIELIKKENVDFNLDMHESDTPDTYINSSGIAVKGGRLAYMLVCHQKGLEIGAMALIDLEDKGIEMNLEESDPGFHGISHREIGDLTQSISFLSESPNPAQRREVEDPDPINDPKYPLKHRVGMHLELVKSLFDAFNLMNDKQISVEGIPSHDELMENGLSTYLN